MKRIVPLLFLVSCSFAVEYIGELARMFPNKDVVLDSITDTRDGNVYRIWKNEYIAIFADNLRYVTKHSDTLSSSRSRVYPKSETRVICPDGWELLDTKYTTMARRNAGYIVIHPLNYTENTPQAYSNKKFFEYENGGIIVDKQQFGVGSINSYWVIDNGELTNSSYVDKTYYKYDKQNDLKLYEETPYFSIVTDTIPYTRILIDEGKIGKLDLFSAKNDVKRSVKCMQVKDKSYRSFLNDYVR